jgi:hypothetical protein
VNFITLLGIVLLCTAWLAVLFAVFFPSPLVLGLGIDVPRVWPRTGSVILVHSHPWFSLLIGLGVLIVLVWVTVHLATG